MTAVGENVAVLIILSSGFHFVVSKIQLPQISR